MGNIQNGALDLEKLKYLPADHDEFPKLLLEPGDVLFNRTNSAELVGKTAVYRGNPPKCSYASYLIALRLSEGLPEWVSYYLNSTFGRNWIKSVVSQQVGQANVNGSKLKALEIPLPPLPEQRRIVARIEEIFSRLDAGVAALRHAKAQRYRQSVLAAAVTGQLTQAWREQNPQEVQAKSSNLFGEPLPKSWTCHSLENVVSEGPRNGYSPKCGAAAEGSRVLKLSATSSARMLLNEKTTKVSLLPVDPNSHAWLQPNDVLIQRANSLELLGSTAIYQGEAYQYVYPDLMMRVRLDETATREFLVLYLNSLLARNYFQRNATGVAGNMPKINGATLKALPVPMPSLAEQHQIVAKVEARTTAIDHLEADLDRQITRSNRLRKSTLASAFAGHLQ